MKFIKEMRGHWIRIIICIVFLALTGVIVFLVTRPFDYRASFEVNTTPDIVYYNIENWDIWNRKHLGKNIEIIDRAPVENISQKILLKDTTIIFDWKIMPLNDSATEVTVNITDLDRKFINRLTVPFFQTRFKKRIRTQLIDFRARMDFILKSFRHEYTGYHMFRGKPCVYIDIKSTTKGKARAMISNVALLNQFVKQNNLGLDGNPFVIIHDWKQGDDSIHFDFCFPINNTDMIPEHSTFKFREVEDMEALKTDFFGNYGLTEITWYGLADKAAKSAYKLNNKIIEVYFNDPHLGGNELEWKAEIYLGIEK